MIVNYSDQHYPAQNQLIPKNMIALIVGDGFAFVISTWNENEISLNLQKYLILLSQLFSSHSLNHQHNILNNNL